MFQKRKIKNTREINEITEWKGSEEQEKERDKRDEKIQDRNRDKGRTQTRDGKTR